MAGRGHGDREYFGDILLNRWRRADVLAISFTMPASARPSLEFMSPLPPRDWDWGGPSAVGGLMFCH